MSTTHDQAAWDCVLARLDALEAERQANAGKIAALEQANAHLQDALDQL